MSLVSLPHDFAGRIRRHRLVTARAERRFRLVFVPVLSLPLFLILPELAWAVQSHAEPEGLVAHQLGHVLFTGGMLFLLARSRLSHWTGSGWRSFKAFLMLIILWNVLTFVGHQAELSIAETSLVKTGGRVEYIRFETISEILFYLASLDHLILLPALFFLLLALKQWSRTPEGGS